MKQPIDYIFIDTSLFISASFFKENGVIERFFNHAEKGYIKILMPAITEIEWQKHFDEAAKIKFDWMEKLTRIIGSTGVQEFVDKHSSLSKDYDNLMRNSFRHNMERANLERLPIDYPNDQLKKIFDKYFAKEKPFGSNGKKSEFPDAFVLASLEKYAKKNGIDRILVFAKDKDMTEYASDCLFLTDSKSYLNDLVASKIPELEQMETKRISKDISRLYNCINTKPESLINSISKEVDQFLTDSTNYLDRFAYAEIESIVVDNLDFDISVKDLEIHSINEDDIEALCFVDIDAKVSIKYFNEEESIWDSEEKEYIYKSFSTVTLDLSSVLPVTLLFPRLEDDKNDGGIIPDVEILMVDFVNLQDVIDNEETINNIPETTSNDELPKLVKDMIELKEKVNSMALHLNKGAK